MSTDSHNEVLRALRVFYDKSQELKEVASALSALNARHNKLHSEVQEARKAVEKADHESHPDYWRNRSEVKKDDPRQIPLPFRDTDPAGRL